MSTDPDQIRAEIERTRADLSNNVDALTDKVSPNRIVERRVEGAKSAIGTVKERVMGTTSQATSSTSSAASAAGDKASALASGASDAVHSAPGAAKAKTQGNPFAAGLIAFGIGWLASSLMPATAKETELAGQVKDLALEHKDAITAPLKDAASQAQEALKEPAQQAVASVKETAQDAVATVKDTGTSAAQDVAGSAHDAKDAVRDSQETRTSDSGFSSTSEPTGTGWGSTYASETTSETDRPYSGGSFA